MAVSCYPSPIHLQDSDWQVLRFFRRLFPSTLRLQLMLVLVPVVGLPIAATGYLLKVRGLQAIVEEKRVHLQGVDALLAQHLAGLGGYRGLMAGYDGAVEDREAQIRYLNSRLSGFTDQVAGAFPGIGVGYFHRGLDAIITYGPSGAYGHTVGRAIPPDHPGWQVMGSGRPMTVNGGQVRGNIMNAMLPIQDGGQVVGYIWANELLDAIDLQARAMSSAVRTMTILGFALSLALVFFVIAQLARRVEQVKQGLSRLGSDLGATIPPIPGELGEIGEAINHLAHVLLETRQQVARADRLAAVGEVAAGIAHELRTPLTSIRGFVQFLQGSTDPQEWKEYGDIIIREVDGMNRIISELLALVRPHPLNLAEADVSQLVEETLFLARDSSSKSRIAFVIDLDRHLPPVRVDRGAIKQVLLNVLVNAIQAIEGQGTIRITTSRHAEAEVVVQVADDGVGLTDDVRQRLFDPFFSTKPTGTGLGMAIARRIIEGHHGRIEVASTAGEGSLFSLILPCLPAPRASHES